jgi:hypothetical protein
MTKLLLLIFGSLLLGSCMRIKPIGDLTMISTRNIDRSMDYVLVKNYQGLSKAQKRRSKAKDIEEAVNFTVKSTPGGEYLTNVKLYIVNNPMRFRKEFRQTYVVEGDVWGFKGELSMKGFKVGDKVFWNSISGQSKGVIVELKNDKQAAIQIEGQEKVELVNYDKLTKLSN